jgi:magnesium transporter
MIDAQSSSSLSRYSETELADIAGNYGLHPLAVEDAGNGHQISKLDVYGDQLFIVARTAHLEGDHIAYGSTAIFLGKNFLITVRQGSARSHSELRAHLEITPDLLREGPDYVLHAILDFIVDGYFTIVEAIEEDVLKMEQRMLAAFLTREEVTRIFTLRRELVRFQRVLGPMLEVGRKLVNLQLPRLDEASKPYFRDLLDHMLRGAITRQLAAWAAILAVPTAIAGIYGMNFENMPELKTQWGYFVILGVIAAVCIGLYIRFKRNHWL